MASQEEEFIIRLKDKFSGELRDADGALDDARESADGLNDSLAGLKKVAGGLALALGLDAFMDAAKQMAKLQGAVRSYTGQSGAAADSLITQARAIADTYDEEASSVLQVANSMTKQMGGTMEENLALIQKGFARGANSSGEFIDTLREYPAVIHDAGIGAEGLVSIIAQAAEKGIYSDKAVDTIKEASLSLREMTQIQQDALAGIGVDAQQVMADINSGALSPFQAMQKITAEMKNLDVAAKQTVIADVFKGAGEDAGEGFIDTIANLNLNLNQIPESQGAYTSALFELNTLFNQVKTTVLSSILPAMASLGSFLANNVPLLKGFAVALGIVTAAFAVMKVQAMLLNLTLMANPIVLIIGAIAALVGAVVWAYNEFETFRNIVNALWEGIKWLGVQLWEGLTKIIKSVGKFIMKYHPVAILMRGVKKLFPKFFKEMMDRVKKFTSWLSDAWGAIKSFFGFGDDAKIEVTEGDPGEGEKKGGSDGGQPGFKMGGNLTGGSIVNGAAKAKKNTKSGIGTLQNSAPKSFNININKLIDNFTIETNTIEESRARIQAIVMEALLAGVNDVQSSVE